MQRKTPIHHVNLSFVCDKDWNSMAPRETGRHCEGCNKTVIDFTDKSLDELQSTFAANKHQCGRFKKSQLRPNAGNNAPWFKRFAASLLMALGFNSSGNDLMAQTVACPEPNQQQESEQKVMVLGMVLETLPVYKHGGEEGMLEFLRKKLKYPEGEKVNGLAVTTFVVDTTGKVTDPIIAKSLSPEADKEALRMVKLLEFIPGMQAGRKTPMRYTLPIRFTADAKQEE